MERKILVAYVTNAGSTTEVAQAIGDELTGDGARVDVRPLQDVVDLAAYEAVVVGGPMILGWHREAVKFVGQHQEALSQVPVAYFMTALRLTWCADDTVDGVPIYQDPSLAKPPKNGARLGIKDRYATVSNYLNPALSKASQVRPVSVGFFNGKLDSPRLNLFSRLFVKLIVGARDGDFRNWEAIRTWAADLRPALVGEPVVQDSRS